MPEVRPPKVLGLLVSIVSFARRWGVGLFILGPFLFSNAYAVTVEADRIVGEHWPRVLASITVTTTADTIDAAATCPTVTLASLPGPDGQTSLREAICAANTNAGPDTIVFAVNGVFVITGAANEDNGGSGDFDVKQSLSLQGNGVLNTIIDGGGIERIFDVFPTAATTFAIADMAVRNGDTRLAAFKEGGAIYLHNNVTTSITNSQIINNFSGSNGAIENRGSLSIDDSILSDNQTIPATGTVVGGALHNAGPLTINDTTINNNSVRGEGGGIATTSGAAVLVSIINTTISNNTASVIGGGLGNGGGISTTGNQGTINITNSTISGNHADTNGGGANFITPGGGTGNVTLTGVTVTNNTADNENNGAGLGGGIAQNTAAVMLRSTIVAGNFNSLVSVRDDISGAVVAVSSFNLVGDGTGSSGITNGVNSNQVGSGASPLNAQLGPLQNNGGPTQTHKPATGFPGQDKGCAFGSATDQRGMPRTADWPNITNGSCDATDIGSFEILVPTAGGVVVAGRVVTIKGIGISGVRMTLTDSGSNTVEVFTNTAGFYVFEDVPAGESYTLTPQLKPYTFTPQILMVEDNMEGVNFVGILATRGRR